MIEPTGFVISCVDTCELGPAGLEDSCCGRLGSGLWESIMASKASLRLSSGKSAITDWMLWLCEMTGFCFSFCSFSHESLASHWEVLATQP